jgi:hypothetical protein
MVKENSPLRGGACRLTVIVELHAPAFCCDGVVITDLCNIQKNFDSPTIRTDKKRRYRHVQFSVAR